MYFFVFDVYIISNKNQNSVFRGKLFSAIFHVFQRLWEPWKAHFIVLIGWWPWKFGQSHQNPIKSFNCPNHTIHKVWSESFTWFKRANTLIRVGRCFAGRTGHFVGFVTLWLIFVLNLLHRNFQIFLLVICSQQLGFFGIGYGTLFRPQIKQKRNTES